MPATTMRRYDDDKSDPVKTAVAEMRPLLRAAVVAAEIANSDGAHQGHEDGIQNIDEALEELRGSWLEDVSNFMEQLNLPCAEVLALIARELLNSGRLRPRG